MQVWTKMIPSPRLDARLIPGADRARPIWSTAAMSTKEARTNCGCPVMAFQKMISGKYKVRILWDLKDGPLRYGEIRSGLLRGAEGTREIAPRVLSRELKALAHTGLIVRKDY